MSEILATLQKWTDAGALRPLDVTFTRFIKDNASEVNDALLLAVVLLSQRNGQGHVCLDLQAALQYPEQMLTLDERVDNAEIDVIAELKQYLEPITLQDWVTCIRKSDASNAPASPLVLAGTPARPLLYLRRYWNYEQQIQQGIQQRVAAQQSLKSTSVLSLLKQLFAPSPQQSKHLERQPSPDWQKIACAIAVRSEFAIITGGPGTGKTTTVVRLLALLQGLQMQHGQPPLTIHLAAPTGKAAARLSESLSGSVSNVALPDALEACRETIPTEVSTLHRLLGSMPGTRQFRHHAGNPLRTDLVVVDEASMVDVEMLANLFAALPTNARLILLGDKDQLASVEAGSVLGDFCQFADQGHYTLDTAKWVKATTEQTLPHDKCNQQGSALAQVTTMLHHSYRFEEFPGIKALATLVNTGTATYQALQQVFETYARHGDTITNDANLQLIQLESKENVTPLQTLVKKGYHHYLSYLFQHKPTTDDRAALDDWALATFKAHRSFQLLTAVRQGSWGIESLNQLTLAALRQVPYLKECLPADIPQWYAGRPVLVTRNDYNLKLMNGDIGICFEWPESKVLRVAFPDGKGGIRWVLPSRLQGVETVFAMTVHKSQGSEFTHTALVLPSNDNPVLTKELLYTGITRSSEAFTLVYSDSQVLANTLTKRVERASGLQ